MRESKRSAVSLFQFLPALQLYQRRTDGYEDNNLMLWNRNASHNVARRDYSRLDINEEFRGADARSLDSREYLIRKNKTRRRRGGFDQWYKARFKSVR